MKNFIKKKWNNWKIKVDKHNEQLGYVNYDESWEYGTIFAPIFTSLLIVVFAYLFSLGLTKNANNFFSLKTIIFLYLGVLSVEYLALYLNWKAYD